MEMSFISWRTETLSIYHTENHVSEMLFYKQTYLNCILVSYPLIPSSRNSSVLVPWWISMNNNVSGVLIVSSWFVGPNCSSISISVSNVFNLPLVSVRISVSIASLDITVSISSFSPVLRETSSAAISPFDGVVVTERYWLSL